MAIARVNTTSQSNTNVTASVNIPAVTAGNTIILLIADGEFNSGATPSVSDNAGNTYTLQAAASANTVGNPTRRNARIWTVFNANGGASNIFIIWPSSCTSRITVVEYSGVKLVSPLERTRIGNNWPVDGPVSIGNIRWDVANSLLISINSNNATNNAAINAADTPAGGAWTIIAANLATVGGSVCDKLPTYANPVPPNVEEHQGLTGNPSGLQCFATLVILKADLTLSCNETITTTDTDDKAIEQAPRLETMTFSALVDALLNGNERFYSAPESITPTDAISFLSVYFRTLQETFLVLDTLTFMNEFNRTLPMETVRIQDWMSIKKTNSTRWGS